MISYNKSIEMRIHYLNESDARNQKKELHLRSPKYHDSRIPNPMEINIPGTDTWITVDAVFLKEACDKLMKLQQI